MHNVSAARRVYCQCVHQFLPCELCSARYMPWSCVCVSVTSRSYTKMAKCRNTPTTPQRLKFSDAKNLFEIQTGSPKRGRQMQVGYNEVSAFRQITKGQGRSKVAVENRDRQVDGGGCNTGLANVVDNKYSADKHTSMICCILHAPELLFTFSHIEIITTTASFLQIPVTPSRGVCSWWNYVYSSGYCVIAS